MSPNTQHKYLQIIPDRLAEILELHYQLNSFILYHKEYPPICGDNVSAEARANYNVPIPANDLSLKSLSISCIKRYGRNDLSSNIHSS